MLTKSSHNHKDWKLVYELSTPHAILQVAACFEMSPNICSGTIPKANLNHEGLGF